MTCLWSTAAGPRADRTVSDRRRSSARCSRFPEEDRRCDREGALRRRARRSRGRHSVRGGGPTRPVRNHPEGVKMSGHRRPRRALAPQGRRSKALDNTRPVMRSRRTTTRRTTKPLCVNPQFLRRLRAREGRASGGAGGGVVGLVVGSGSDLSEEPAVQDVEPVTLDFESCLIVLPGLPITARIGERQRPGSGRSRWRVAA